MLDIKFIRENPEKVKKGCERKGEKVNVEKILRLDEKKRKLLSKIEKLRAEKKKIGKKNIKKARKIKEKIKLLEKDFEKIEKELNDLLYSLCNLPLDDVPFGKDEKDNVEIKRVGELKKFKFKPKDYLEIAQKWDLIDIKRASKVSGTRFCYLKNEAVLLEFALVNLAMEEAQRENFIPIIPPVLVREEIMKGMGYIDTPEDLAERYYLEKDKLFLVGTAEQSIGPLHKDEIFKEKELPKRYIGFSSCFREEAGSYGKESWGIFRVHQFDKLELFSFVKPENSQRELSFLVSFQERLLKLLEIPYRVVQICTGDLSRPSAAAFDIECYFPSRKEYRETHSASNCTDFQSRRLNIRYRNKKGELFFVHTLNATAFAIGRTLIAIIENYQRKDGKIDVPKVLQKYLGFKQIPRK